MDKKFEVKIEDIYEVTSYLKGLIKERDLVILLEGDLASGKTTLVKALLKEYNMRYDVTSPTFCLQNVYGESFYHYDIYNKSLEEFISLGLLEEFEKNGIHCVEWGNNSLEELLKNYGFELIKIKIDKLEDKRRYIIYA